MTDGVRLREMTEADWPEVAAIWAEGIATGNATFETEPPSWAAFDATRRQEGRFVAEHDGAVVGWAALSPVSSRPCYAGVAENSVYVAASARGEGVGTALMEALADGGRGGGDLDDPDERVPGERRQHRAARAGRVPRRRPARADRRARRRLARHALPRAPPAGLNSIPASG